MKFSTIDICFVEHYIEMKIQGSSCKKLVKSKSSDEAGQENHKERYLSINSTAKLLDMTPNAVRGLIRRREVGFKKIQSRVRIPLSEIKKIMIHYPSKSEFSLIDN